MNATTNRIDCLFTDALAAHRSGDLTAAERGYRAFLDARPGHPDTEHLLGVLLYQRGDAAAGLARIDAAIARNPRTAEYHANRALTLLALRRPADAEAAARTALALREAFPEAHNTLGLALRNLGRPQEAEAHHRRALALRDGYGEALVNLATALLEQDRFGEAEACLRSALRGNPGDAQAWSNLGAVLRAAGQPGEAENALEQALRLASPQTETLVNLGLVREALGRTAEAEEAYRVAASGGHPLARFNLSLLRLAAGDLAEGFDLYESRFEANPMDGRRPMDVPEWRGEDPRGLHLMVWRDQGLGDLLMFGGCLRDLPARRLTVECDARLTGLLGRALPQAEVMAETRRRDGCDRHAAITSLARPLRRSLADFARAEPGWLTPEAERAAVWRARLDALGPGLKVGVCWRSRLMSGDRRHAYTVLADWKPLFAVPGIVFVNLQYDARAEEFAEAERLGARLHRWDDADLFNDLETAAALTAGLDLVVTVATSAGELAGALGVPTWRLMPGRDWTMLGTAVRPWFPSQRVFLPPPGGTLAGTLDRVAAELRWLLREGDSLAQLDAALKRRPDWAGAHADRAAAQLGIDDDGAALSLRRALALDPALAEAWNTFAALTLADAPREARHHAGRAIRINPAYPQAWTHQALALGRVGDRPGAVTALRTAHRLAPADPGTLARLADALAANGEAAAAGVAWWRIILLSPAEGEAFEGLARLRAGQGNPAAAARAWQRAAVIASVPTPALLSDGETFPSRIPQ